MKKILQYQLPSDNSLQLCNAIVNPEYFKEWNERILSDFLILVKDGKPINDNIYRIGGMNNPNPKKDRYFILLKYVEDFYADEILEISKSKDPKHLSEKWCIIDQEGNEKIEFSQFKYPYLVKDSCLYSLEHNYYNIESGELICNTNSSMESEDYIFLNNRFDKDKSKRGVLKVCKKTGSYEIFPNK